MFSRDFLRPILRVVVAMLLIIAMVLIQNYGLYNSLLFWVGMIIQIVASSYVVYTIFLLSKELHLLTKEKKKNEVVKNEMEVEKTTEIND